MEVFTDEYFMAKAIELAMQAYEEEEIPIGALVVY
jgi:tRNA(Arg) A34 adenosine deaminase TadA